MLYKNKIRCKICGDVIESIDVHDYQECRCGACYTDGGLAYCHRGWNPKYGSCNDVIEEIKEQITHNDYEKYNIGIKYGYCPNCSRDFEFITYKYSQECPICKRLLVLKDWEIRYE